MNDPQAALRPLPLTDNVSRDYWRAAADGRLLVQRCRSCDEVQFYPRSICVSCGGPPEWLETSGRGRIHTFTVIRQNQARPFKELLPYVVAMVELEEGPMLMGNVTGVEVEDVCIGLPVEVYFTAIEDGLALPMWRAAATA